MFRFFSKRSCFSCGSNPALINIKKSRLRATFPIPPKITFTCRFGSLRFIDKTQKKTPVLGRFYRILLVGVRGFTRFARPSGRRRLSALAIPPLTLRFRPPPAVQIQLFNQYKKSRPTATFFILVGVRGFEPPAPTSRT